MGFKSIRLNHLKNLTVVGASGEIKFCLDMFSISSSIINLSFWFETHPAAFTEQLDCYQNVIAAYCYNDNCDEWMVNPIIGQC